jgi:hypothetical protein
MRTSPNVRFLFVMSIAALVAIPATTAQGQERIESVLQPGVRVRYSFLRVPTSFTGVISRADATGILVRPDGYDGLIHLGLDSLRALAVYGGVRSAGDGAARGTVAGFRIGAVIGLVATAAVWLSSADERCQDCWISSTAAVAVLSALGTLGSALLGGLLGAVSPGDVWHEIPLRHRRP